MLKNKITYSIIIILTFLLAGIIRFYNLNQAPPGIWYDEAYNGLDAINTQKENKYQIFYPENYGREGLFINTIALSFRLFDVSAFSLRLPSAIFGLLTVVGFFLWLSSLRLHRPTIIIDTIALATSFYHLNFSRISFRAIMVPLFLVWSFYFFTKGFQILKKEKNCARQKTLLFFFLSGLLTGIGLHTYIAYRVVPLIFIVIFLVSIIIFPKFIKKVWLPTIFFLAGAIISAAPLLLYFKNNPSSFTGRTDAVSIFNAPNLSTGKAFFKSLFLHLQSIFFIGDGNQRHNYNKFPLLPATWSLFFSIGFIISLREIFVGILKKFQKEKPLKLFTASLFGQTIFWVMLIPGVLSLEGIPHFLRIIGITPAIFLITVIPFEYLHFFYQQIKKEADNRLKIVRWKIMQIAYFGLIATFILVGVSQVYTYFSLWKTDPLTHEAFQRDQYLLGTFIKELPTRKENYLIIKKEISLNKNNRRDISEKSLLFSAYPAIEKYQIYHNNEDFQNLFDKIDCSNTQIILQPNLPLLPLKKIKNYCRNLKLKKIIIKDDIISTNSEVSPMTIWILQ